MYNEDILPGDQSGKGGTEMFLSLAFITTVWSLYTIGLIRQSETFIIAAFVVSYFGMGLAALLTQQRLEGVLKTYVKIFALACAFIGLGYFGNGLGLSEDIADLAHNPGRLLLVIASFVVLLFLLRLNRQSGAGYLVGSLVLGLLAGVAIHYFIGPGSQPDAFIYWLFLVFAANAIFLSSFYLLSALWTWGGVWSNYFLLPFVIIALSFGFYCMVVATNLTGLERISEMANIMGHAAFFNALVNLYSAQRQPSGIRAG